MQICYEFKIKLREFGIFLEHICMLAKINYELFYEDGEFALNIDDSEEKILIFNEYFKKFPYFLFLEDFVISRNLSKKSSKFKIGNFKLELNLSDDIFSSLAPSKNSYEKVEKSEFVMLANYELLQKAFVCDKNSQILLNSYEKPFIRLKTKKLYKDFHNLDDFYYVCFANTKSDFDKLKNSDELCFIKPRKPLIIQPFSDTFCVLKNPFCDSLSNAFNIDKLSFNLPKNKAELESHLKSLENGEKLLNNYEKKFLLKDFSLSENNIFALFKLASILLQKDILNCIPNAYTKGVRIDCDISSGSLNVAKFISSIMSFILAGASNIEIGVFESLVAMLGKINPNERLICTKLARNLAFLNYNAFLNPHLKLSKWENCECNY